MAREGIAEPAPRVALLQPALSRKRGVQNLVVWTAAELARRGCRPCIVTGACEARLWEPAPAEVRVLPELGAATADRRSRLGARALRALGEALHGSDAVIAFAHPSHSWVAQLPDGGGRPPVTVAFCNEPSRHRFFVHTDRALDGWAGSARPVEEFERTLLDFARKRAATAHGLRAVGFWRRCRRESQCYRAFDAVLVNSAYTAESVRRVTGIRAEVCPLGVPLPPERRLPGSTAPPRVLLVSTEHPVKNLPRSLAALGLLAGRGQEFRVSVAGEGTDSPTVRAFADRLGLGPRIAWEGAASDARLHELLSGAAVLLYVPLDEPFGLLPLEALVRGTAVVVPDHGGPAELVRHEVTGLQVDAFSTDSVAAAVSRLLDKPELRQRLAAAGEREARSAYSLAAYGKRLHDALSGLLEHAVVSRSLQPG
jgi:glycosyltransferase involved in cell wall biosynthesis